MKDIIKKVLEANQDINMASEYAREYLAEEIEKEVQSTVNRIFMEEYELIRIWASNRDTRYAQFLNNKQPFPF